MAAATKPARHVDTLQAILVSRYIALNTAKQTGNDAGDRIKKKSR